MTALRESRRGSTALEYAVVAPAFLTLVFGVIDVGRLVWFQVALDRATQAAARCANVNATACGSNATIQAYAAGQVWGTAVPAADFAVTRPTCGVQVTASAAFRFVIPWLGTPNRLVQSSACYPAPPS